MPPKKRNNDGPKYVPPKYLNFGEILRRSIMDRSAITQKRKPAITQKRKPAITQKRKPAITQKRKPTKPKSSPSKKHTASSTYKTKQLKKISQSSRRIHVTIYLNF